MFTAAVKGYLPLPRDVSVRDNYRMKNQPLKSPSAADTLLERIEMVLKEKGWTPRFWSMEATGKPDTVRNILREKSTSPRSDTLAALAKTAGKPVQWLLGEDVELRDASASLPETIRENLFRDMSVARVQPGQPSVPIMGTGAGGRDGLVDWNGEVIGYIPMPASLIGAVGAYALYVTGESMVPRYFDGELIHVHPGKPLKPGAFVVVQMRVGEDPTPQVLIKQFKRKTANALILHQFNPDKDLTFPAENVLHVHRIVGSGEG